MQSNEALTLVGRSSQNNFPVAKRGFHECLFFISVTRLQKCPSAMYHLIFTDISLFPGGSERMNNHSFNVVSNIDPSALVLLIQIPNLFT